jgi:hypothetical protein
MFVQLALIIGFQAAGELLVSNLWLMLPGALKAGLSVTVAMEVNYGHAT